MLGDVNKKFRAGKNKLANDQLIVESVVDDMDDLDEDEVMELVNGIDNDPIPAEIFKDIDSKIDKIIDKKAKEIQDNEIDDDDIEDFEDELDDEDLDDEVLGMIDESVNAWTDDESIGHPDMKKRSGTKKQPCFEGGSMV